MVEMELPSALSDAPSAGRSPGRVRLLGLVVTLAVTGLLVAVGRLTPRANGYGTHTQLGMSSCGYLARTGYPCPGCGMTTSVAAMARGQASLAMRAQPFGALVVILAVGLAGAGLVQAVSGRNLLGRVRPRWWWLAVIVAAWLAGWGLKLVIGLAAGQYPLWQ
jgi:hypothetical protein